jgi:hypothetical protein
MRGQLDAALQTIHKVLGNRKSAFPDMFGQVLSDLSSFWDERLKCPGLIVHHQAVK